MQKRPYSAIARPSSNLLNKFDDAPQYDSHQHIPDSLDHFNTTLSKFGSKIPLLGITDQSDLRGKIQNDSQHRQKNPQNCYDVEQQLHQASYSLKLNQVDEALENYKIALTQAAHVIPSFQFVELFGQVFKVLNTKAMIYLKDREFKSSDKIIQALLQWTQITKDSIQADFLSFIKCPTIYQATILNSYSLYLIKKGKFNEGQGQLEKALNLLSCNKIDEPIHLIIGQTYLNYSSSLIYQQLYQEGMQVAQTALTHLQQGLLQLQQQQDSEELTEQISDAYINIAICKEKSKLYQEAHFHYYSALVNAQKYLSKPKQNDINNIYDKFLSRQAGYLHQMTTISKKHLRFPSKTPQTPFIDVVKSYDVTVKVDSIALLRKQRIVLKQKRDYHQREQQSMDKFHPYSGIPKRTPSQNNFSEIKRIQKPKMVNKLTKMRRDDIISRKQKDLKQYDLKQYDNIEQDQRKTFRIKNTKNFTSEYQFNLGEKDDMPPSQILRCLENIINNNILSQQNDVILLEDFQDIQLAINQSENQLSSMMVGKLLIYLFRVKHLLYFRYSAYKQDLQEQSPLNSDKDYHLIIIGHSFNVSDVVNEIYSNKTADPDKIYALFLREFITEVCRQLYVNLGKQALALSKTVEQMQNDPKQLLFFLNETNEYISVQQKNDYESLVFITQDPQLYDQRDDEIRPLVFIDYNSREDDDEEEIQPLIANSQFKNIKDNQTQKQSQYEFRNQQQLNLNEEDVLEEDDDEDIKPLILQASGINSDEGNEDDEDYDYQQNMKPETNKKEDDSSQISDNIPYDEDQENNDIKEESYSQVKPKYNHRPGFKNNIQDHKDKVPTQETEINQNIAKVITSQRSNRLLKQTSLPSQMMFGRKDQEMFTIKVEEDKISKEIIEVYVDKKSNDQDVHKSMDQDMENVARMIQTKYRFKKSQK